MRHLILLSFILIIQLRVKSCDTTNIYADYFLAKKEYGYNHFGNALKAINRFQQTESFDTYAAQLKLKILHQIRSKKLIDEFFVIVKQTGISIEDLQYNALKTKNDSLFFLAGYSIEDFNTRYNTCQKEYLHHLSSPYYSIEITKILAQDQAVRLLPMIVDTWKDSLNNYIFNQQLGYADSVNFIELKELIKKNGLPTVQKIGNNQFSLVFMAAMHISVNSLTPEAFHFFDSVFIKTVEIGQMNPEYYMFFRDAVSRKTKDCQIYGYLIYKHPMYGRSFFTFCDDYAPTINKNRKKIGAGAIEDACRYERVYGNFKKK